VELKGLDFLNHETGLIKEWKNYWPSSGSQQNWDAVGWLENSRERHLLLVEAKAHVAELNSQCGSKDENNRSMIRNAFESTQRAIGANVNPDTCMENFYQKANRLAVLHFLVSRNIPAHLIFVYFVGDGFRSRNCPETKNDWSPYLNKMDNFLGIPESHPLKDQIHNIFLPVSSGG